MKYLIKDLSKMTGVKGSTIRKWQERYGIFDPQVAPNGYWYYSNDDYIVLNRIVNFLERGDKISKVVALGREYLLKYQNTENYSQEERNFFRSLQANDFSTIEAKYNQLFQEVGFRTFVREHLHKLVIFVGRGWNDGLISVADEHAFSRWFIGYLSKLIQPIRKDVEPIWLVASFPGDTHELGALMHYALLCSKNIPVRFVGSLPIEHIVKELVKPHYKAISFSLAVQQPLKKIEKIKNLVLTKTKVQNIYFGGRGIKLLRKSIRDERK
jgi:DNA-binding transcriptional MerR regulator